MYVVGFSWLWILREVAGKSLHRGCVNEYKNASLNLASEMETPIKAFTAACSELESTPAVGVCSNWNGP